MSASNPPVVLFGFPTDPVSGEETVTAIASLVDRARTDSSTHQVATLNVDFLVNARADPDLAHVLRTADLCLADGAPLVWTSRAIGRPLPERVAGADLVPALFAASAETGHHVYVFGSSPDVMDRTAALVAERFPGANVTVDAGPMIDDVAEIDDEVLDAITDARPDILLVALGNPKQERFIAAHGERLGVPVAIGVGGSLDMFVGNRRRAPQVVQRLGLEWVYRAAQEPKRLGRRYARDLFVFLPWAIREIASVRRGNRRAAAASVTVGTRVVVELGGDAAVTPETWSAARRAIRDGAELHIETHGRVPGPDAIGCIVGLRRTAARVGTTITISGGTTGWPPSYRFVDDEGSDGAG